MARTKDWRSLNHRATEQRAQAPKDVLAEVGWLELSSSAFALRIAGASELVFEEADKAQLSRAQSIFQTCMENTVWAALQHADGDASNALRASVHSLMGFLSHALVNGADVGRRPGYTNSLGSLSMRLYGKECRDVLRGPMEDAPYVARPAMQDRSVQTDNQATAALSPAAARQATATVAHASTSPSPSPVSRPSYLHAAMLTASGSSAPVSTVGSQRQQPTCPTPRQRGGATAVEQQAPTADSMPAAESKREQQRHEGDGKQRRRRGRRGGKRAKQRRQTNAPFDGQQYGRHVHGNAELELCAILGRGFNAMTEVFAAVLMPRGDRQGPKAQQQKHAPHAKVGRQQQKQQRQEPPPQSRQQQQQPAPAKREAAPPEAPPSSMAVDRTQLLAGNKRDRSESPEAKRSVNAALPLKPTSWVVVSQ